MTPQEFIAAVAPVAVQLRLEGSPIFPSVRIAQAMLETGCQLHSWNNLVGFKVGSRQPNGFWKGAYVNKGTWEVYDGKRSDVVAAFRAYDCIADCFRDQDDLFTISRYDRVRNARTPREQTAALYECGYATDPEYAVKLNAIVSSRGLAKYDEEVIQVLDELKAQITELQGQCATLLKTAEAHVERINTLEKRDKMPEVPEWAKEAVCAAEKAGMIDIDVPLTGSYDFYRTLAMFHRKGLF